MKRQLNLIWPFVSSTLLSGSSSESGRLPSNFRLSARSSGPKTAMGRKAFCCEEHEDQVEDKANESNANESRPHKSPEWMPPNRCPQIPQLNDFYSWIIIDYKLILKLIFCPDNFLLIAERLPDIVRSSAAYFEGRLPQIVSNAAHVSERRICSRYSSRSRGFFLFLLSASL